MMKPVERACWKCRKDFLLLSRFNVCSSTGWWRMYGRCMWGCDGTCPWSPVAVFRSASPWFPVGTENSGAIERNITPRLLSKMHKQTVCFPHACLVCTKLTFFELIWLIRYESCDMTSLPDKYILPDNSVTAKIFWLPSLIRMKN